jgi:aminoglycoside 2'-N-acetyltransferase I
MTAPPRIRRLATDDLTAAERGAIRAIMDAAFGDDEEDRFTDDDWDHALGGLHVVLEIDGSIVTHAAVVERVIEVEGRPLRTGYVEAVATAPGAEGRGHGSRVMTVVTDHIRSTFQLGALGADRFAFYERLGWRRWAGPSFVRTAAGLRATPDDDGFILVLTTPSTPTRPALDWSAPISCDWRPGDAW